MTIAFEFTGFVVLLVLTIGVWPELVEAWRDKLFRGQPGIFTAPLWPTTLCTLVGSGLGAAAYVSSLVRRLGGARKGAR